MSTVPVTLLFADGVAQRCPALAGQNLVEAATAAGLNLLTDCGNGQCGTCTAQLVSGCVALGDYDASVLPAADRAAGAVLPCVCSVSGPCVVELPYDSSEALGEAPQPLAGRIVAVEPIASETVRLELAVGQPVWFEPGQYVRIRAGASDVWRSYSMANRPGAETLVFFIRVVAGGAFSQWLAQASAGDAVAVSVPRGSFFLRGEDRPRLFVAGGTGLAPFLSMLDAIAAAPPATARTTVLVGARTRDHLFAVDALERLRQRIPNLDFHVAVQDGAPGSCHAGYATDLISRLPLDPTTRVYLCGPPPMVEAGRAAAVAAGLARADVLCERFT